MKRILFVALSATLLAAGCQKTEIINPVGNEINFSTNMGKLTKATPSSTIDGSLANVQGQGMSIVAYKNYDGEGATSLYDKMSAYYDAGWINGLKNQEPAPKYYWPGTGMNLDFYAVSGYDIHGTDAAALVTSEGKLTINTFTLSQTEVTDLMVAKKVTQHQDVNNGQVPFVFTHALSLVEFYFKSTNPLDIVVKSVTLNKVAKTADLTAIISSDVTFEWKKYSPATDADKIEYTGDKALTKGNDFVLYGTKLALPQTIFVADDDAANLQATINYTVDGISQTNTINLGSTSLLTWGANQHVKYNVTFAAGDEITFTANVANWTPKTETTQGDDVPVEIK